MERNEFNLLVSHAIEPFLCGTCTLVRVQGRHVTVALPEALVTAERGHRLLSLEKILRAGWHPQAEVFLEAKGDLNKLRIKLRGVTV